LLPVSADGKVVFELFKGVDDIGIEARMLAVELGGH
jgi:hypothetical protein